MSYSIYKSSITAELSMRNQASKEARHTTAYAKCCITSVLFACSFQVFKTQQCPLI